MLRGTRESRWHRHCTALQHSCVMAAQGDAGVKGSSEAGETATLQEVHACLSGSGSGVNP